MTEQSVMTNGFHEENVDDHASISPVASIAETAKSSRASSRLTGSVKWFNAKQGYGFVTRNDTGEDIFVHFTGISRKNPLHSMKSLGDGEPVEFNLMATHVTGPRGSPVRGNPYVSHIPVRRNDSFAAGDPAVYSPNRRFYRPVDGGSSRIPRWNNRNTRD